MDKITTYFRGVAEEAKRVRWPDQKTLWKSVAIVLIISIVSALAIVLSDWLTIWIMKSFEIAFPSSSTSAETSSSATAMLTYILNGGLF